MRSSSFIHRLPSIGVIGASLMPLIARAGYFDPEGVWLESGLSTADPTTFILAIIQYLLGLLALIALVLIIYAGFMIMTSTGNEERVQKGFATLRWTVIGLLFIMSSWGIVLLIDSII